MRARFISLYRGGCPQPHPRAVAVVVVDKCDSCRFESLADDGNSSAAWRCLAGLKLLHGKDADARLLRQMLLTPIQKAACRPALCCVHREKFTINQFFNQLYIINMETLEK